MAKKARRGRPPGSKNKKKKAGRVAKAGNYAKMEVGQLRDYSDSLQGVLAKKVSEQRKYFDDQLATLGCTLSMHASLPIIAAVTRIPRAGERAKPKPKYQSK